MDPSLQLSEDKENLPSSNFVPPPTPLLKRIGYGTGVSVYHLDRSPYNNAVRSPWALKKVNRQHATTMVQERIDNEAKILQSLKHPNIVGFRGYAKTEDGRKVLAMEECSVSLGDLIEQLAENGGTRFGAKKILNVIIEVSKALKYLHEDKGLLHGDLKSHNVLIKGDFEEIKLCDFGVTLDLKTTQVEDFVGTGAWSAPEVLRDGPLTEKADIFSLGLIIWEMLTLKTPNFDFTSSMSFSESFDANNSKTMNYDYEKHFGETPELPEGLPTDYALVEELYVWCTQQSWDQRPRARDILIKLSENDIPLDNSSSPIIIS